MTFKVHREGNDAINCHHGTTFRRTLIHYQYHHWRISCVLQEGGYWNEITDHSHYASTPIIADPGVYFV